MSEASRTLVQILEQGMDLKPGTLTDGVLERAADLDALGDLPDGDLEFLRQVARQSAEVEHQRMLTFGPAAPPEDPARIDAVLRRLAERVRDAGPDRLSPRARVTSIPSSPATPASPVVAARAGDIAADLRLRSHRLQLDARRAGARRRGPVSGPPPTPAAPDQSKVLDYFTYTLALGVGLLLYVPDKFLPAGPVGFWLVVLAFALTAISILTGLLIFGALNRMLSGKSTTPGLPAAVDKLGWLHLGTLAVAFLIALAFYVQRTFLPAAPAKADCTLSFPLPGTSPPQILTLTHPCTVTDHA